MQRPPKSRLFVCVCMCRMVLDPEYRCSRHRREGQASRAGGVRGCSSICGGCAVGSACRSVVPPLACTSSPLVSCVYCSFRASWWPVCRLQDQLIIFMALADGTSRMRCTEPTLHTRTAMVRPTTPVASLSHDWRPHVRVQCSNSLLQVTAEKLLPAAKFTVTGPTADDTMWTVQCSGAAVKAGHKRRQQSSG